MVHRLSFGVRQIFYRTDPGFTGELHDHSQARSAPGASGDVRRPRGRSPAATAVGPPEHLAEPLSQARVLSFLQTSLSAPEIARELYVSVNTVRTHMRHLYDKLGAHRRLEAIDRARALGLLAPVPQRALCGVWPFHTHTTVKIARRGDLAR